MSQPVKMILSGGRGVVGSAMVSYMKAHHPEVDLVHLQPFPFSVQSIADAVKDPHVRYFVNCAGVSSDVSCTEEPYTCYQANVVGVMNQLEVIRRHAPRVRYLTFGSIYEDGHDSPYASTKRISREIVRSYREDYGVYAVVAKLGFTESCGRAPGFLSRKIVAGVWRIAKALKRGEAFEALAVRNLHEEFSFTWAEDVAVGVWAMLNQGERSNVSGVYESRHVDGPITRPKDYTLANPRYVNLATFIELAFEEAGIKGGIWDRVEPIAEHGEQTFEWVDYVAKIGHRLVIETEQSILPSKTLIDVWAEMDLGWRPTVSFPELVKRMMACEMEGNP